MVDWKTALVVAEILRCHPRVQEVQVFGSVARSGRGRDLDLILVSGEGVATDFLRSARYALSDRSAYREEGRSIRLQIARRVLGSSFETHTLTQVSRVVIRTELDVFIFPPDWRGRLTELQAALPHGDPQFMRKIAQDAVTLH